MKKFLKYTYYELFNLYHDRFKMNTNTDVSASFTLGVLLVFNLVFFTWTISFFFYDFFIMLFRDYFVVTGILFVSAVIVYMRWNTRYLTIIETVSSYDTTSKIKLRILSIFYISFSIISYILILKSNFDDIYFS
jgi:hypothetical protein